MRRPVARIREKKRYRRRIPPSSRAERGRQGGHQGEMDHFLQTDVQERGAPVVHRCELRLSSPLLRGAFNAEDGRPGEAHPRMFQLGRFRQRAEQLLAALNGDRAWRRLIACTSFPWTQPLMTISVTRHPTRERARILASGVVPLGA